MYRTHFEKPFSSLNSDVTIVSSIIFVTLKDVAVISLTWYPASFTYGSI